MRKLFLTAVMSLISFSVFAQEQPSYSEQIQKLYNQTNAQALQQFNKTYPKPEVPKISESSNSVMPAQPTYSRPAQNNVTQPQESSYQAAPPPPDVAVKNTENKQGSSGYNIFLPPGSNNNQTPPAPNPYR